MSLCAYSDNLMMSCYVLSTYPRLNALECARSAAFIRILSPMFLSLPKDSVRAPDFANRWRTPELKVLYALGRPVGRSSRAVELGDSRSVDLPCPKVGPSGLPGYPTRRSADSLVNGGSATAWANPRPVGRRAATRGWREA